MHVHIDSRRGEGQEQDGDGGASAREELGVRLGERMREEAVADGAPIDEEVLVP
jgi:hypothetical protein